MRKIGLLLGSFDPPHIGHMYSAMQALEQGMDGVWLVPAWQNPWKSKSTNWFYRVDMCVDLVCDYDGVPVTVSSIEEDIKPTYSYETLQYLKWKYSDPTLEDKYEFTIIGGGDTQNDIKNWKEGQWILDNFKFLCVPRITIDVSSTKIRNLIKEEKCPYPFISQSVYKRILDKNLYKNDAINS